MHCLWVLIFLLMGRWLDLAYTTAMLAGLAVACGSSHPALKVGLLGVWTGWWTYAFVRWGGLHLGIVLMMAMTVYVMARAVLAWRREGAAELRVGHGHPIQRIDEWPEVAGLTKQEKRLVVGRAAQRLPRRPFSSTRFWVGAAVFVGIAMLEFAFYPPPDSDSNGVALARSTLGVILIAPFLTLTDPRDREESSRRALRDHVLPEFWRQPWLWGRARRETVGTTTALLSP